MSVWIMMSSWGTEEMLIIVRWEEFDEYGDYEGESRFCETWEEAVEFMKNCGKMKFEVEVEE